MSPWDHSSQRVSRDLEVEQQTTKEDIFWRQIEMRELILVGLGLWNETRMLAVMKELGGKDG